MKDRGTRNAIFNIHMLSERSIEHQQDIYLVFIDYKKAFDKVRHGELLNLLQAIQVDDKDLRILRSVYVHQRAAVRLSNGLTNRVKVRQGCIASLDLFNLYGLSVLLSFGCPVHAVTLSLQANCIFTLIFFFFLFKL